jgi:hypothetical protein
MKQKAVSIAFLLPNFFTTPVIQNRGKQQASSPPKCRRQHDESGQDGNDPSTGQE